MDSNTAGIVLCCSGLAFVVLGILIRLGFSKGWFMMQRVATVVIPSFGFGLIPVGLGFVVFGFPLLDFSYKWIPNSEIAGNWLCWGATPLWGFGLLLVAWQPRWALPKWFWWLKENYGDIMVELRQDARRLGKAWLERVRTQEGLEQWAEEVRQRVNAERQSKGPLYKNR